MRSEKWKNADDFILGRRCNGNKRDDVKTIVSPTRTVKRENTNTRTIRKVHPTHIKNINRNITRIEHYYPVTESERNINSVEEYNCGSDLNNPRCRPINRCQKRCCK